MIKVDEKTANDLAILVGSIVIGLALFSVGLFVGIAIDLSVLFK